MRHHGQRYSKNYSSVIVVVLCLTFAAGLSPQVRAAGDFTSLFAWGIRNDATAVPADLTNAIAIASSYGDNLALKRDGTVLGWGESIAALSPTIGTLTGTKDISVGYLHGLALLSNGTVVAWGDGTAGENAVPPGLSGVVSIAAGGHHNVALRTDGTIVAWGANNFGETNVPAGLSGVIAIAASPVYNSAHNLALKANGSVVAWGDNFAGQATVPTGLSNVIAVAAGWYHSLALKSDGTVVGWGDNGSGQAQPPAGVSNVIAIVAGAEHSLAVKADGSVVGWGSNFYGQRNPPAGLTDVIAVSAGRNHSIALSRSPAIFLSQPQSRTVYAGSDVTFQVQATGPGTLSYQWLKDGGALPGATSSTLMLTSVNFSNAGNYLVSVSNVGGSITSAPASLAVVAPPAPTIEAQPQSVAVYMQGSVAFSVTATTPTGDALHYQWSKDGIALLGATASVFTINNVHFTNAGTYTVVVTNYGGSVTSSPATLTVLTPPLPSIQAQPQTTNAVAGSSVTFNVTASGGTLFYEWRKDGVAIPGATARAVTLMNVAFTNAGTYTVIVSNYSGSITSAPASLTVRRPPDFNVITITPTYQATQFAINGQQGNPTLTLMRGRTYMFSIATGSTHPFEIVTSGGVPYNTGVSNNNISSGTLTFTVPETAPNTLRYICSVHFFGGTINIVDSPPASAFRLVSLALTSSNVVLKSLGTNGWLSVPEFSSNLVSSSWTVVPSYNTTFQNGTNTTVFNRLEPICGPNVFLRVKNTQD